MQATDRKCHKEISSAKINDITKPSKMHRSTSNVTFIDAEIFFGFYFILVPCIWPMFIVILAESMNGDIVDSN